MPSPFPGMDPYIESCGLWGDFHHLLISDIHRALAEAAPERYFVRTGERSYHVLIGSEGKEERPFTPDVKITAPESGKKPTRKSSGLAMAEPAIEKDPLILRAFIAEDHREAFVEIYEAESEQRLVTTIEVLSPSNKRLGTEGWNQYQSKRQSIMLSGVNLVEIDLLRGGQRHRMLDPWPNSPYTLLVARGPYRYQRCKVWKASFQHSLPEIPVPLDEPDEDIPLRLQPMIEAVYKRSRYGASIDYKQPLKPPLRGAEATWAKAHLHEWQKSK